MAIMIITIKTMNIMMMAIIIIITIITMIITKTEIIIANIKKAIPKKELKDPEKTQEQK